MPDTEALFDSIARSYDSINDYLSFGIHRYWRQQLLKRGQKNSPQKLLDLCTGTGDLLFLLIRQISSLKEAIGIDISNKMLAEARDKLSKQNKNILQRCNTAFFQISATKVPFPESYFDLITIGFGIRNVPQIDSTLQECRRLLQPGGKLLILEFGRPINPLVNRFYQIYLRVILPTLGGLLSGTKKPYKYLATSAIEFPRGNAFTSLMEAAGFTDNSAHPLLWGICWLYEGSKRLN
ncbi:MAG: bifunctional demethylmenaquinone methyltransferase/2-methoxy-6-polyprenyl-1,4-benzoquinol methylase UbiE [Deltaproteobacteria bacterium]|nr:bifunctional demethylmenaquinone methyltransferase/2-methoxy-6-polyprenyl-1,4-benzoquinol methylase UbiE [Deltaproteobacteria bacterium]